MLGPLVNFAFECLLHFVQLVDGELQALAHAIEGIHKFVEFLAALGDFDVLIEVHFADGLRSFYELSDRCSDETARKENDESSAYADLEKGPDDGLKSDASRLSFYGIEAQRDIDDAKNLR